VSTDVPRLPLNTKEGWSAFVSRSSRPEPPRLLSGADLERLDPDEQELYDYARMDYHSELNLINTPTSAGSPRPGRNWFSATAASSSAAGADRVRAVRRRQVSGPAA